MDTSFNPAVYTRVTAVMQRMLHRVSHGYYYWASGEVPATKALQLASKFAALYAVDINDRQRAYARSKGKANAALFFYPIHNSNRLRWWLLVTDGTGAVHQRERLRDTRKRNERLAWDTQYEVARGNRKGKSTPSWTWRMTPTCEDVWKKRLKKASTSSDDSLMRQAVWSLYRTPGFAGNRKQVGHLLAYAKQQWKGSRRTSDFPPCPVRLYYVSYRKCDTEPLSNLVLRASKRQINWFGRRQQTTRIGS